MMEQTQTRFYLYEPKSKLFVSLEGINSYWSVSAHTQIGYAYLTNKMSNAYSADSKEVAKASLKTITEKCSYASIGMGRGKVELDDFLGCKVDNSAISVIINVKWLVVKEATCTFSMEE